MAVLKVSQLRIGKVIHDQLFLNEYLMENGKENRKITQSPHYNLLAEYEANPDLDLTQTDYYQFAMTYVKNFGRWFGKTNSAEVVSHMREFLKLYEDIKLRGFDYRNGKIIVFRTVHNAKSIDKHMRPHPPTPTYVPEDYEIVEGHHRAAILAKLGIEKVDVDYYSKFNVFKNYFFKLLSRLK